MPNGHIEHANLTVSDPQRSAELLEQLCGWHERWRGGFGAGWLVAARRQQQLLHRALFGPLRR
ncbi:hypothetical protein WG901_18515 [Novosphingobium sp. PS1R-30]|uniref:Uncharacterized protein n=1 Tax=Novosphingobium anseongense TaxID=3133436 RepID=A0ABU8S068_9SPHN